MKQKTLLILDMHGTALNTDIPMLDAITTVINKHFPTDRADNEPLFSDYTDCLQWLNTQGITKKEALEGNKKEIFRKLLDKTPLSVTKEILFQEYETALEKLLIEAIKKDKASKKEDRTIIPAGFEECIAKLQTSGIILGFASNSSTPFLCNVLESIGIEKHFNPNAIIGSDKKPKDKTGEALALALEKVNAHKPKGEPTVGKVIFVGDAAGDRDCLEGFKKTHPTIQSEFIMMKLPGRQIDPSPEVSNEKTCNGFHGLGLLVSEKPLISKL
jgi:phosphoglycolate phosphatase-like HAD superfamily hydrolase